MKLNTFCGALLLIMATPASVFATSPTVSDTNTSSEETAVMSHTVNLPSAVAIANGDLVCVVFASRDSVPSWPDGTWTTTGGTFDLPASVGLGEVRCRKSDGSDGSTITVTTPANAQSAHISFKVLAANWHGTTMPVCDVSGVATGSSNSPDPTSYSPAGGSADYMWVGVEVHNSGATISAYPSNLGDNHLYKSSTAGTTDIATSIATAGSTAASFDTNAWTLSSSPGWAALTCAVYPSVQSQAPRSEHQYKLRRD